MLDIYVKCGTPSQCATCGKLIRRGQRTVTDGKHDFDTCQCARDFENKV